MPSTEDILRKYERKIEQEIGPRPEEYAPENYSEDYENFKQDLAPENSKYRTWAQALGSIINIKISEKDRGKIQKYLSAAHLDVTPSQALTLAIISFILVFFGVAIIAVAIYFINGSIQILFLLLGLIASIFVFYYTYTLPRRLANKWRLKASAQMVPAILYIVVYMKHTSNLERAIAFAAEHLDPPLALDFKKVFYDVEVGKFPTIKQSLDNYLENWSDYSPEFIESIHLIESSLYEPSESRRVETLEKALQVILDGVYEKLLKYSREIRSPLTNIYMLGIILPTLALALLPLASTLLQGVIQAIHVFVIFNILIPFFVFYMATEVLLKRPGGYGETEILEKNPNYYQFTAKSPWVISALLILPLLIIGFLPFILQASFITDTIGIKSDYTFSELGIPFFEDQLLFDFKTETDGSTSGPFGIVAMLLSLLIPLSIALFFSMTYATKTKELIKSRKDTKDLESEFTNSIFQLGNRLGDGIPAEIAFSKVARSTQGLKTQNFFALVSQNITQLGMSVKEAIFNPKRGAIIYYPSSLIATSMKILVESSKKGLKVAARSLISISEYVKNIQKITERLKDLLAEIVSDMRSNMTFLAPLLSGIVVGLASMITIILNKLQILTEIGQGGQELAGLGSVANITNIFNVTEMIPPYFIQTSIGLYIVQITFILTTALVTVNNGKDDLEEKNQLSKNLKRSIWLYTITSLIAIISLSILAEVALSGLGN